MIKIVRTSNFYSKSLRIIISVLKSLTAHITATSIIFINEIINCSKSSSKLFILKQSYELISIIKIVRTSNFYSKSLRIIISVLKSLTAHITAISIIFLNEIINCSKFSSKLFILKQSYELISIIKIVRTPNFYSKSLRIIISVLKSLTAHITATSIIFLNEIINCSKFSSKLFILKQSNKLISKFLGV